MHNCFIYPAPAVGEVCRVDGQLRLTHTQSITTTNAGRVEICMGGEWGTISTNSSTTPWSEKNAQVACIELGFSGALNSILQHTYAYYMITRPIYLAILNPTRTLAHATEPFAHA